MTTRNTTEITKILRENEKRRGWGNKGKWFEIDLGKASDWWNSFLRHTWKELRITPGELEESGKILGKDLWVRAHWRDNTVKKDSWKDRWCTGTIEIFEWGDNLELIQTHTNLLRYLEHSGRINWRVVRAGKTLDPRERIWSTEKLELNPLEKEKEMKNVEQNKNSLVEINYGRLKGSARMK